MSITARTTPIWKKQKLYVGLFLLAFGGYFFWDGAVGWPRSNERFLKHREFAKANDLAGWRAYAKGQGWSAKPPEKLHTPTEVSGQFIWGAIPTIGGLLTLMYLGLHKGRTIQLDDEGVKSPAGRCVPFSAITGLGLKKWDAKGYAIVRYTLGGRQAQFVVDDYKFETEPAHAIVDEIKRRLESRAG
ncbi:MAG: hypothetical protein ABMA13_22445 [Chthoniobacteraceae bacterium]